MRKDKTLALQNDKRAKTTIGAKNFADQKPCVSGHPSSYSHRFIGAREHLCGSTAMARAMAKREHAIMPNTEAAIHVTPGHFESEFHEHEEEREANHTLSLTPLTAAGVENLSQHRGFLETGCSSFGRGLFLGLADASNRTWFCSAARNVSLTIAWLGAGCLTLYLLGSIALKIWRLI